METLRIQSLSLTLADRPILNNFSLTLPMGQLHVLMGPNGTGKSSLAKALAGHPDYQPSSGEIWLNAEKISGRPPYEISRAGLFLAFQNPIEIPGLSLYQMLRTAYSETLGANEILDHRQFYDDLQNCLKRLQLPASWANRGVNESLSGGEKKRCEILQMMMLRPRYAILDEIDSGLDVDATRQVAEILREFKSQPMGLLLISHQRRLLDLLPVDQIHLLSGGKIVRSGDAKLAQLVDKYGFERVLTENE